jgi:hypothetical protein
MRAPAVLPEVELELELVPAVPAVLELLVEAVPEVEAGEPELLVPGLAPVPPPAPPVPLSHAAKAMDATTAAMPNDKKLMRALYAMVFLQRAAGWPWRCQPPGPFELLMSGADAPARGHAEAQTQG